MPRSEHLGPAPDDGGGSDDNAPKTKGDYAGDKQGTHINPSGPEASPLDPLQKIGDPFGFFGPDSILRSKWFWIGAGVVGLAGVAYVLHEAKEPLKRAATTAIDLNLGGLGRYLK